MSAEASQGNAARREWADRMIRAAVDRYEGALEQAARLGRDRPGPDDPEGGRWGRLAGQAEAAVHSAESSLAYLLEEVFEDIRPDVPTVHHGPFEPFGIIVDGASYIIRHDPADMAPGIVARVDMDRLADVEDLVRVEGEDDDEPTPPPPPPLTDTERFALSFIRLSGEREAMARLTLSGHYQVIFDAISRLGDDAVAELRRMVEERRA